MRADGSRQTGSALLVSLVLVLISSLIGISVMETSGVETRLVASESQRQRVFAAAESVAERAFATVDPVELTDDGVVVDQAIASADDAVDAATSARLESIELAVGYSAKRFQAVRYRITVAASIDAVGAQRTVHLGAWRLGTFLSSSR